MSTVVGSAREIRDGVWLSRKLLYWTSLVGASCSRLLVHPFRSSTSAMDLLVSLVMKRRVA
jgi:hypothetical protein